MELEPEERLEEAAETPPAPRPRTRTRKNRARAPVFFYMALLFAAAFLLLAMSHLMQQRIVAESLDGLKERVSAMERVEDLLEENQQLKVELTQLQAQAEQAAQDSQELSQTLEAARAQAQTAQQNLEKSVQAMDWLWQLNEAYVRGRYTQARTILTAMGTELPLFLPTQSVEGSDRPSPALRYQEILQALG